MVNWDLLILFPILLVFGSTSLGFVVWKEKIKGQALVYLFEIACFWLLVGFMFYSILHLSDYLGTKQILVNKRTLILIFTLIMGGVFVFINPIAVFLTTICKSRKIWNLCAYFLVFVWILCYVTLPNSWYLMLILMLLLVLILPTATIQILTINEQIFYKINTVVLVWTMVTFGSFFFFTGFFLVQINVIYMTKVIWLVPILLGFLMLILFFISIFRKENKENVGTFDDEIIEQLPKTKKVTLIAIYGLAFLVTLGYILSDSIYVHMLVFTNLNQTNFSTNQLQILYRTDHVWFLLPIIFFSYLINKYILNYIGQKNLVFIGLISLFCLFSLMAFITNGIIIIALATIASFVYFIVLFSLFSFALFWNYRVKKQPVVGWFWASVFLAVFLVKFIENTLLNFEVGVLGSLTLNKGVVITAVDLSELEDSFSNIATLIFASGTVFILSAIVLFTTTEKQILADFKNYKFAVQNLQTIIKNRLREKTKTQIEVNEKQN